MKTSTKTWVSKEGIDCQSVTWESETSPLYMVFSHVNTEYVFIICYLGIATAIASNIVVSATALNCSKLSALFVKDPYKPIEYKNVDAATKIADLFNLSKDDVLTIVNKMWSELPA